TWRAPQLRPWATSSPARATPVTAAIHRGVRVAVVAARRARERETAAAGMANARAWEAGYPRAIATRAPAAVVTAQAGGRAAPGPAPGLAPDRRRQVSSAAVRPAATSSQL